MKTKRYIATRTKYILFVSLALFWLSTPLDSYAQSPIALEPTHDTDITPGSADSDEGQFSNFGQSASLRIENAGYIYQSYLSFNPFGGLGGEWPALTQATLSLRVKFAEGANTLHIHEYDAFDENLLTWNNANPYGPEIASISLDGSLGWVDIDLTSYVQTQITSGKHIHLALIAENGNRIAFESAETNYEPALRIWTAATPTPSPSPTPSDSDITPTPTPATPDGVIATPIPSNLVISVTTPSFYTATLYQTLVDYSDPILQPVDDIAQSVAGLVSDDPIVSASNMLAEIGVLWGYLSYFSVIVPGLISFSGLIMFYLTVMLIKVILSVIRYVKQLIPVAG